MGHTYVHFVGKIKIQKVQFTVQWNQMKGQFWTIKEIDTNQGNRHTLTTILLKKSFRKLNSQTNEIGWTDERKMWDFYVYIFNGDLLN